MAAALMIVGVWTYLTSMFLGHMPKFEITTSQNANNQPKCNWRDVHRLLLSKLGMFLSITLNITHTQKEREKTENNYGQPTNSFQVVI